MSQPCRIFIISPAPSEVEMAQYLLAQNPDLDLQFFVVHYTFRHVVANVSDCMTYIIRNWGKKVCNLTKPVFVGNRIEIDSKLIDFDRKHLWKEQFSQTPITDHLVPYIFPIEALASTDTFLHLPAKNAVFQLQLSFQQKEFYESMMQAVISVDLTPFPNRGNHTWDPKVVRIHNWSRY